MNKRLSLAEFNALPDWKQSQYLDTLTINERILLRGWFDGTSEDWYALPREEREERAFNAVGCLIAFPTWEDSSDCCHTACQIRRGELPTIVSVNRQLLGEIHNGWLRFDNTIPAKRAQLARLCVAMRNEARRTGVYDIWKLSWQAIVFTGIASA